MEATWVAMQDPTYLLVLFFVCFAFAMTMFLRERAGKPIFQNLEEPKKESPAIKTNDVKVSTQA